MKIDHAMAQAFMMRVAPDLFRSQNPSVVRHRASCPCCGRKLVNVYRYKNEWLCRTCLIAANHVDERMDDDRGN